MKMRIFAVLMLCLLLSGCANAGSQPEHPAESAPIETMAEETAAVIRPLPDPTMEALDNAVVNISFSQEDVYRDEAGTICLRMRIYSYDKYDMVDISGMKAGDTILLSGEEIPVSAVERNDHGTILVNGGLDAGGFDLATDDDGIYYQHGYSDMKSWNLVGEAQYPLSDGFVFTDSVEGEAVYSAEALFDGIPGSEYGYQPQNTTVRIENGRVVAMERIYTP